MGYLWRSVFRSRKRLASLSRISEYRHKELVLHFCEKHQVSYEEGEILFNETKKLLWLMGRYRLENARDFGSALQGFAVYWPMRALDEMWHEFLLFTEDYAEFCSRYLGGYLHHTPKTAREKERHRAFVENNAQAAKERMDWEFREICRYVADTLGPDTLRLWFQEFPRRFNLSGSSSLR